MSAVASTAGVSPERAALIQRLHEALDALERYPFHGNVRELPNLSQQFPTSIVVGNLSAEEASFFELEDKNERVVPRIDLGSR